MENFARTCALCTRVRARRVSCSAQLAKDHGGTPNTGAYRHRTASPKGWSFRKLKPGAISGHYRVERKFRGITQFQHLGHGRKNLQSAMLRRQHDVRPATAPNLSRLGKEISMKTVTFGLALMATLLGATASSAQTPDTPPPHCTWSAFAPGAGDTVINDKVTITTGGYINVLATCNKGGTIRLPKDLQATITDRALPAGPLFSGRQQWQITWSESTAHQAFGYEFGYNGTPGETKVFTIEVKDPPKPASVAPVCTDDKGQPADCASKPYVNTTVDSRINTRLQQPSCWSYEKQSWETCASKPYVDAGDAALRSEIGAVHRAVSLDANFAYDLRNKATYGLDLSLNWHVKDSTKIHLELGMDFGYMAGHVRVLDAYGREVTLQDSAGNSYSTSKKSDRWHLFPMVGVGLPAADWIEFYAQGGIGGKLYFADSDFRGQDYQDTHSFASWAFKAKAGVRLYPLEAAVINIAIAPDYAFYAGEPIYVGASGAVGGSIGRSKRWSVPLVVGAGFRF